MRNRYIVTYDVSNDDRRNRVFRVLRGCGDHIQYSVFRCDLSDQERITMIAALHPLIEHKEDQILVINLLGRVHMDSLDDPFAAVDKELEACPLGAVADAIVVDMHAEATSEKMAMGHFCDGRASLVVGTHTHVPTADCQILLGGTAYQTDAGACADYDSVIGNQKEEPLRRFTTRISGGRYKPASGPATVCGVFVETDDATGLARRVEPIRIGGRLSETVPVVETVAAR